MTKVYTGNGDAGFTDLLKRKHVEKTDRFVVAIGDLDELSAFLGLAKLASPELADLLTGVQKTIYAASAHVSAGLYDERFRFPRDATATLEREIDRRDADLPPLKDFIHPGQSEASTRLHVARTVARRVERSLWALGSQSTHETAMIVYFNRLSDLLFVLARWVDHQKGLADVHYDSV